MLKKNFWTNLQGFDLHIAGGILKALLAANILLFIVVFILYVESFILSIFSYTFCYFIIGILSLPIHA